MRSSSSNKPNRLIHENSPYLLQHAYNPVDWYSWGKEAFQTARQKKFPVFLSIGYSTCHWCHVMEKESFEDPEIADMMNRTFICIKVDREERPDIDSIYMKICQQMTERCGWPLTVIMTPERVPFFISTYVPKKSGLAGIGMADLIPQLAEIWQTRQDEIVNMTEEIKHRLDEITAVPEGAESISPGDVIDKGYRLLEHYYDQNYGGFGRAPKFPVPHNIMFLLRHWNYTGNIDALKMAEKTLTSMRLGGIFDHVGYGFHRYSTDGKWKLPHFEKMLNDQALLALAYTEAYQATGKEEYKTTARKVLRYVLRDMRSEKGGFYSAEDADSEGVEGKFYLWTEDEIHYILTQKEADLICRVFNVKKKGNFAEESTGKLTGKNILYKKGEMSEITESTEKENEEIEKLLDQALDKLYEARSARVHPLKDDKILTDWNGLMIAALAKASGAFQEPEYVEYAKTCTEFILDNMYEGSGKLLHRYHQENAGIDGFVDDYAAFVWGLIELYEATFEERYLQKALEINDYLISHFRDGKSRGFYFSSDDRSEDLILRNMEICDTSMPSGNSMAVLNILRLAKMTGNNNLESVASEAVRHLADAVSQNPISSTYLLSSFYFASEPGCEVVIAGEIDNAKDMIQALQTSYIPQCVYLLIPADPSESFTGNIGHLKEMKGINGIPTAYVCRNYTCSQPVTDTAEMMDLIEYGKKNH